MQTTTKAKTSQADYLEPDWSKAELRKIDDISDALSPLPDSILSVIETAFLTFEAGMPFEVEQERPDLVRDARKMVVATQVARCL